jgi:hypothetical protein
MKLSSCWRSALFQRQRKPDEHVDEDGRECVEVAGLWSRLPAQTVLNVLFHPALLKALNDFEAGLTHDFEM